MTTAYTGTILIDNMKNTDDILKRAIELFEQDREKDAEIGKQSLSDLDIPEKYYDRAKKELADKQKRYKKLFIRNITLILVIVGLPVYLLVTNFVLPFPELIDHNYTYNERSNELKIQVRILKEGKMNYELIYELVSPDNLIYDSHTTTLGPGSKTYPFTTRFTSQPLPGNWTIRLRAKLRKYGFNKKIIGEVPIGSFQ